MCKEKLVTYQITYIKGLLEYIRIRHLCEKIIIAFVVGF